MNSDAREGSELSRTTFEQTSKYQQFLLAAACALSVEDTETTMPAMEAYIGDREDYTSQSLRRALDTLVERELLEVNGATEDGEDVYQVPDNAWEEVVNSTLDWSLGVGGRYEHGRWTFADTPRIEIGYGGDDLDGELAVEVTPTTITGMTWRRRLVLGALRVREVQQVDEDGPIAVDAVRDQVGEDVISKRGVRNALVAFDGERLVNSVAQDSGCPRFETTGAGRAAFALFLRCWWNVIPDERRPFSGPIGHDRASEHVDERDTSDA